MTLHKPVNPADSGQPATSGVSGRSGDASRRTARSAAFHELTTAMARAFYEDCSPRTARPYARALALLADVAGNVECRCVVVEGSTVNRCRRCDALASYEGLGE